MIKISDTINEQGNKVKAKSFHIPGFWASSVQNDSCSFIMQVDELNTFTSKDVTEIGFGMIELATWMESTGEEAA